MYCRITQWFQLYRGCSINCEKSYDITFKEFRITSIMGIGEKIYFNENEDFILVSEISCDGYTKFILEK